VKLPFIPNGAHGVRPDPPPSDTAASAGLIPAGECHGAGAAEAVLQRERRPTGAAPPPSRTLLRRPSVGGGGGGRMGDRGAPVGLFGGRRSWSASEGRLGGVRSVQRPSRGSTSRPSSGWPPGRRWGGAGWGLRGVDDGRADGGGSGEDTPWSVGWGGGCGAVLRFRRFPPFFPQRPAGDGTAPQPHSAVVPPHHRPSHRSWGAVSLSATIRCADR